MKMVSYLLIVPPFGFEAPTLGMPEQGLIMVVNKIRLINTTIKHMSRLNSLLVSLSRAMFGLLEIGLLNTKILSDGWI